MVSAEPASITWMVASKRRGAGGADEQDDLHPVDRHADIAGDDRVAAGGEDPVAEAGLGQHVAGDAP